MWLSADYILWGGRARSDLAVHIGARVMGMAGGGEVLTSGTVKDLVAGSEIDFAERGEHELRDVPGRWRLFSVVGSN